MVPTGHLTTTNAGGETSVSQSYDPLANLKTLVQKWRVAPLPGAPPRLLQRTPPGALLGNLPRTLPMLLPGALHGPPAGLPPGAPPWALPGTPS